LIVLKGQGHSVDRIFVEAHPLRRVAPPARRPRDISKNAHGIFVREAEELCDAHEDVDTSLGRLVVDASAQIRRTGSRVRV